MNPRRPFFLFLLAFFLIHFSKDITQDLLHIPSPLDIFGDVQEDLSSLPRSIGNLITLANIGSFVGEAFLLFSIPIVLKRKRFSRLEFIVIVITVLMLAYFLLVLSLDPRFRLKI